MIHDTGAGPRHEARRRCRARVAAAALALLGLGSAVAGCGSSSPESAGAGPLSSTATADSSSTDASYGSLPTYLPTTSLQADSVLTGTVQRPALTTEGDGVDVRLASASALATVTGPDVPGEGLPYVTPTTTCTWTVTVTGETGTVPIRLADFTTLDHLGHVYRIALVPGRPAPPATIGPKQTVRFELRTMMPTGEGLMRWAPLNHTIVASWDFEVEND